MADPKDSLLREIDEELRQEHYAKLWKKYGTYVVGAAAAMVLGVAGYQGWITYDISTRRAEGERFVDAQRLAREDQPEAAQRAFARLAEDAGAGYALLSRFQDAALMAQMGDRLAAAAAYRGLAEDTGIDALYQDLALVLGALQEMNAADPTALIRRLAPLTADDNPWRYSAREITAILARRSGEVAKARELFSGLASDGAAPQGIRARAAEMLAVLGG